MDRMNRYSHKELSIGESIAVNGVCLTVASKGVWRKRRWRVPELSMFIAHVRKKPGVAPHQGFGSKAPK